MRQDCLYSAFVPRCVPKVCNAQPVQFSCDGSAVHLLLNKHLINIPDATHFMGTTSDLNNTVSDDAFSFATKQDLFRGSVGRYQHPSQSVSRRTSLTVSQLSQSFLASIYLTSQFSTKFSCHYSLQGLHYRIGWRAVILELFSTVADRNPRGFAKEFVICCLVDILKASPAAHVIYENHFVGGSTLYNIMD